MQLPFMGIMKYTQNSDPVWIFFYKLLILKHSPIPNVFIWKRLLITIKIVLGFLC